MKTIFLIALCFITFSSFSQEREMTIDNLFQLESFSEMEIDPSGRYLAYVIKRSKKPHEYYQRNYLNDNGRADIWLYDLKEGKNWNLTKGNDKAEGFWNPVWSPNGSYLAMLSTIGNDNVRALVWNKKTNKISRISDRGINTRTKTYGKSHPSTFMDPLHWVNNKEIVFQILGEGSVSHNLGLYNRAQNQVLKEWPKAMNGYESTSSDIESGVENGEEIFGEGRVLKVNVSTGVSDTIAKGYYYHLFVSNNREKLLGLSKRYQEIPSAKTPIRFGVWNHLKVGISNLKTKTFTWLDIEKPMSSATHKWSSDGNYLAIRKKNENGKVSYIIYNVRTKSKVALNTQKILWGPKNVLFAKDREGSEMSSYNSDTGQKIKDYEFDGSSKIYVMPDNNSLIFYNKAIYRLDINNGAIIKITPNDFNINRVIEANQSGDLLIQGNYKNKYTEYYRLKVNTKSCDITKLNRPNPDIEIQVYNLRNDIGLYKEKNNNGTFLWYSKDGVFTNIKSINTFISEINGGKNETFEYHSEDGKMLKALIHYPSNYDANKKFPAIVWCYMGSIIKSRNHRLFDKQNTGTLNLVPLAEKGYIILVPSMPSSSLGESKDDYLDIGKGVFPAVNSLIEKGIVDPNKIAIGGHSYGGYSVYSLLTQTNRFRTALALSAPSNLLSEYGTIDVRYRYTDLPYEYTASLRNLETGQSAITGTPWTNTLKYIRNSPYFYSDRIETPLLIIQGDLDFVPIEQGESMFTSLYRQGKRAKFVRYWGEGHELKSPANIKDMYNKIFDWLNKTMSE